MEKEPLPEYKSSVVVVDDDASVRRSLTRLLAAHGFAAKGYDSAESLLSEIGTTPPDCVIADLAMPGLNGLDLQRSLADLELEFPIVYVTGAGDIRSSVSAMRAVERRARSKASSPHFTSASNLSHNASAACSSSWWPGT